jgi:hypothetical protein
MNKKLSVLVDNALLGFLGTEGIWTDKDEYRRGDRIYLYTPEDIRQAGLLDVWEYSDPEEFVKALQGLEAKYDFNQCGYGVETVVHWEAIGGASDLAVESVRYYQLDSEEKNVGAVPSFQMDRLGAFVVQTVEREVGVYNYNVCRFEVFIYSPTVNAPKGDYRQMRNQRDMVELAPDVAQEVISALSEDELNDLACAIRAERVDVRDVRGGAGFKRVQRALTVSTYHEYTPEGGLYGDAGIKVVASWTSSSDIVIGESYHSGYSFGEEKRRYIKPHFVFGQPGWALVRTHEWTDWPTEGSGNCSKDEYILVLVGSDQ